MRIDHGKQKIFQRSRTKLDGITETKEAVNVST